MRCTTCTRRVRPVVAFDIDGTLGDYHAHFIEFALRYMGDRGWPDLPYNGRGSLREWCEDEWGIDARTYRDIKLAYRQGGMKRTMPQFPGAEELTRMMREAGAEIWVTTSRPYLRLDSIDPDTREWLRRNRIEYDFLVYGDDKYERLASYVERGRVVGVLDDLPEQYDRAVEEFGPNTPIFRGTLWNRDVSRPHWASDLSSVASVLLGRIEIWKDTNEGEEA